MGCFSVRGHSSESFHGSNSGNCLIAELHVITHKIKGLFMVTNRHHIESSRVQGTTVATNENQVNSSRIHPNVGSENQTPRQNHGRVDLERVLICTMSKECELQIQTEVNSDTDETSKLMPYVCEQSLKTKTESYYNEECPTCLEEYEPDNPKIVTKCSHHFHLSCIYAWKERSDKCPICLRVMEFDENE